MNNYVYQKMTFKEINKILDECFICIMAISWQNDSYIVPMYYEYDSSCNEPVFILESKNIGQKMDYLKSNPQVSLFIQYNCATSYKTVIASGKAIIKELDSSCSYHNMVKIIVNVQEITGRIFNK